MALSCDLQPLDTGIPCICRRRVPQAYPYPHGHLPSSPPMPPPNNHSPSRLWRRLLTPTYAHTPTRPPTPFCTTTSRTTPLTHFPLYLSPHCVWHENTSHVAREGQQERRAVARYSTVIIIIVIVIIIVVVLLVGVVSGWCEFSTWTRSRCWGWRGSRIGGVEQQGS